MRMSIPRRSHWWLVVLVLMVVVMVFFMGYVVTYLYHASFPLFTYFLDVGFIHPKVCLPRAKY